MKKTFELEDLDCANCALKMEEGIAAIPGVQNVCVNYMTQRLTLEVEDAAFAKILKEAVRVCRRIEPDCTILL